MRPAHSSNPNNIYPLFLFIFVARHERIFVTNNFVQFALFAVSTNKFLIIFGLIFYNFCFL